MKKLFYFAFIAFACLASCQKQNVQPENDLVVKQDNNVFVATIEEYGETRATLVDKKTYWSAGDAIAVNTTEGIFEFVLDPYWDGKAQGAFYGNIAKGSTLADYAIYPYSDGHKIDGESITVSLPSTYGSVNEAYVNYTSKLPMIAEVLPAGADEPAVFKGLGAYFQLNFANMPIGASKIVFSTPNNAITGEFSAENDEENNKVIVGSSVVVEDNNNTVTINFSPVGFEDYKAPKTFYIPLPAQTYTSFVIKLMRSNDRVLWEKSVSNSEGMNIKRLDAVNPFVNEKVITFTESVLNGGE